MLALSGLVLAAMLLSSPGAHAGSWRFHCAPATSNDKVTTDAATVSHPGYPPSTRHTETAWVAPSDSSNAMDIHTSFTLSDTITGPGSTCQAALSVTMNITATWVPDPTLPSDPAPPSVKIIERASVGRGGVNGDGSLPSGDVSDGLGDPPDASGTSAVTPTTKADGTPLVPPAHLSTQSGGSFTVTRTFSAHASALNGNAGGTCSASTGLNFYRIEIHAQPYNFRSSGYDQGGVHFNRSVVDNPNATLSLSYVWDSTDGDRTHLGSCKISENVTWDSNSPGVGSLGTDAATGKKVYAPPSPPIGVDPQGHPLAYPDPTITTKPATDYGITDTFSPDAYFSGPQYRNVSWWGDQIYVFSDSATGETATPLPGPASGSFRITRTVAPVANTTTFGYTISTRNYHAGPMVLPGQ